MSYNPYLRFRDEDLILRDELAIDRTLLANERTLMAYLRSSVALLIAGASILHFSRENWFWILGLISIPFGLATAVFGIMRYLMMNKAIGMARKRCKNAP